MPLWTCKHSVSCGHCPLITKPPSEQIEIKAAHWVKLLKSSNLEVSGELKILGLPDPRQRIKLDFVWSGQNQKKDENQTQKTRLQLGLWNTQLNSVVDLPTCELLSPELLEFYEKFRQIPWGFSRKSSIRLRVGPLGQQGIWLDLAHEETNEFLNRTDLKAMIEDQIGKNIVIEIGQRFKRLHWPENGSRGQLIEPLLQPWFETWSAATDSWQPLVTYVGGFTQPSFSFFRLMLETLKDWLRNLKLNDVLEFGPGLGNWSLFLINYVTKLDILESDQGSLRALRENMARQSKLENQDFSILGAGSSHKALGLNKNYDLVFLNPSRSGIGFQTEDLKVCRPKYIVYISCFPETLIRDMVQVPGYRLVNQALVDQFPFSYHYEVMTLFERMD